jgi:hypothetical protein
MSFPSELRRMAVPSQALRTARSDLWQSQPPVAPTPYAYAKAFACAALGYGAAVGVLASIVAPGTAGEAAMLGDAGGAFMIAGLVAPLLTGLVVARSRRRWPVWRIAAVCLPLFLALAGLQNGCTTGAIWQAGKAIAMVG